MCGVQFHLNSLAKLFRSMSIGPPLPSDKKTHLFRWHFFDVEQSVLRTGTDEHENMLSIAKNTETNEHRTSIATPTIIRESVSNRSAFAWVLVRSQCAYILDGRLWKSRMKMCTVVGEVQLAIE